MFTTKGKPLIRRRDVTLWFLPREGHPDYSLWFYTPLLDRRCILFIEDLKPDIIQSLRIVTSELWYANRQILVTDYNEKRMSTHGDDLIAFGKYRGHFLYEILRIDPGYVNWIAFKYTPIIPKQERFVKMAQAYNCVYLDKMLKKKYQPRPTSRFLGKKGDKLSNLTLKITKVRVEDDPYRTCVIGTTPVFFVRQRLTAIDASGNLVNLTFASGNPSHASGQLPSLEHAYRPGEVLHISSHPLHKWIQEVAETFQTALKPKKLKLHTTLTTVYNLSRMMTLNAKLFFPI